MRGAFVQRVIPSRGQGEGPLSRGQSHADPLTRSTKIVITNMVAVDLCDLIAPVRSLAVWLGMTRNTANFVPS